jgi:hypothetical protein
MSKWHHDDEYNIEEIQGLDCHIWIQPRPSYCDRGNFLAHIEPINDVLRLGLDGQDGWPRYYMDLERAKTEIEDWLKKRKQWVDS